VAESRAAGAAYRGGSVGVRMTINTSAPVHRPHKITGSRLTGTCRAARARAGRVTSIKWLKMWHRPIENNRQCMIPHTYVIWNGFFCNNVTNVAAAWAAAVL
jgi:hypothetical protein